MIATWKKAHLVAALATAWLSGACGSNSASLREEPTNPQMVELIATEYAFSPSQFVVESGQTTTVQLRNEGRIVHSISFELPEREITLDRILGPQQSGVVSFTAPTTPGQYTFYCPVGDHRQRGMVGTLIVR